MNWLDGKKTYIGMIALGGLGLAWQLGWIDKDTFDMLALIAGTWTGVAITHKSNKAIKAIEQK